jgi:hypothetical protein
VLVGIVEQAEGGIGRITHESMLRF